jgi:23S rRNA (pseudouridine1915-N3)-methyltransferase
MKIQILCFGKIKSAPLKELAEEYRKRLSHMASVDILELPDGKHPDAQKRLDQEAVSLENKILPSDCVVLLEERGRAQTSLELSEWIEKRQLESTSRVVFVIGSSHGIAKSIKQKYPQHVCLSAMTWTHEWARVLLLEQLYRGYTILKGIPYHH